MSAASQDRSDLVEIAANLVQRGDVNGALPRYVRLFHDNPGDWGVANTLGDLFVRVGRSHDAVVHFAGVAERLAADGFTAKARALYRKILRIEPDHAAAKQRIDELDRQGGAASPFLQRVLETARAARESHPAVELDAMEPPEVPPAIRSAPEDRPPVAPVPIPAEAPEAVAADAAAPAFTPAPEGPRVVDEFAGVEAVAEAELRRRNFAAAAATIERFLALHPRHVRALETLIDVGVDGRLDAELPWAQVRLAEACLEEGRHQQAQDVTLDLIAREPGNTRHQDLLERVTAAARRDRQALRQFRQLDPVPDVTVHASPAPAPRPVPAPAATPVPSSAPARTPGPAAPPAVVSAPPRTPAVAPVPALPPIAPPPPPPAQPDTVAEPTQACPADLREWSDAARAFEDIRTTMLEEAAAGAEERFAESARLVESGQIDLAVRALEEAMCAPHLRTPAGARLAAIHRDLGSPIEALACLEWVAEMPPASEESGLELAYQLALTLEALGQPAQALGVYRELLAEVGAAYRDVAARAGRLEASC